MLPALHTKGHGSAQMAPPHPGGEKTEPAFHHEAFGPEKQKIWRLGAALDVFFFK